MDSLVTLDSGHVIVETVKPLEEKAGNQARTRDFILRLYEAEGAADTVTLNFGIPVKNVAVANMLEEVQEDLGSVQQPALNFRPFEIKTLKVSY